MNGIFGDEQFPTNRVAILPNTFFNRRSISFTWLSENVLKIFGILGCHLNTPVSRIVARIAGRVDGTVLCPTDVLAAH